MDSYLGDPMVVGGDWNFARKADARIRSARKRHAPVGRRVILLISRDPGRAPSDAYMGRRAGTARLTTRRR